MTQLVLLAIGALVGLVIAGVTAWFHLRKYKETAKFKPQNESEVEIARLRERQASLDTELTQYRTRLKDNEAKQSELQTEINSIRDERARLEERARRVEPLELQFAGAQSDLETLRSRLLEESKRVATLAEQSSRVPQLERMLTEQTADGEQWKGNVAELREKLGAALSTAENLEKQNEIFQNELTEARKAHGQLLEEQEALKMQLAETVTELQAERKQTAEKLALLEGAREQFADHFKSLANDILEEKTKRFTDQNKENIGQILEPLKAKLDAFQGKVQEVYFQEGKDRTALAEQVRQLMSLNQQLSADAHNLTKALKGSSNTQGNWGELILERVLESSGLRKGFEYDVKESVTREDGTRGQPDVIVHLPENKELIVDSKVSLRAYEEYTKIENDREREAALARHVDSVRNHIKGLSERNYQTLYGLKSLDCVIMFIPIEPAFILAVTKDSNLWEQAWRKNVLMVSPSTLLFVLRTVAHLWRQEQQNRNVQEIAKRGAELYDKFSGFVDDFCKLGDRLTQARDSYDSAYSKFAKGRGNLIRQAEMLRDLGVKPTKSVADDLIEAALDDSNALPAEEEQETVQGLSKA
jgi:DNA recombination protein RmuC